VRKRIAREEEKRRIELEWKRKIDNAKKILVWRKWHDTFVKKHQRVASTQRSLANIDPTFSPHMSQANVWLSDHIHNCWSTDRDIVVVQQDNAVHTSLHQEIQPSIEELLYRIGTDMDRKIDINDILSEKLLSVNVETNPGSRSLSSSVRSTGTFSNRSVVLCKMAIVLPETNDKEVIGMIDLVMLWMESRFGFGHVTSDQSSIGSHLYEVRTVVVNGNAATVDCQDFDVILFVIPPTNKPLGEVGESTWKFPDSVLKSLRNDTPRAIFALDNKAAGECFAQVSMLINSASGETDLGVEGNGPISHITRCDVMNGSPNSLNTSLRQVSEVLLEHFVHQKLCQDGYLSPPSLEQVSVLKLGAQCMLDSMWQIEQIQKKQTEEDILENAREALHLLIMELGAMGDDIKNSIFSSWPAADFFSSSGEISGYFLNNASLPYDWHTTLEYSTVEEMVWSIFHNVKHSTSIEGIVEDAAAEIPYHVHKKMEGLVTKKHYRQCLESILLWHVKSFADLSFIYVPRTIVSKVLENVLQKQVSDKRNQVLIQNGSDKEKVESKDSFLDALKMKQIIHVSDASPHTKPSNDVAIMGAPLSSSKRSASDQTRHLQVRERNHTQKRPRLRRKANLESDDLRESKDFTSKLEALLHGEATIDTKVGNKRLVNILGRLGDKVELPKRS